MRPENYRDSISTVDQQGKRIWVYPQKPKGRFHNYRVFVSLFLLAFMFVTPFIKYNGHPLFLGNFIERKFIVFGVPFWPQDFYLVALVFLLVVVIIVVFTVILGRVFCGWVCPQTIFMEMVFRKIEYWIEGDYTKQKKLDKQEWNTEKIIKRVAKHSAFYAISFAVGNTVLLWIFGSDEWVKLITEPVTDHLALFSATVILSGVFYWIFAFFREQVCTIACPYGRLQGVLLDQDSIVISYDYERGEPRGKFRKNEVRTEGDCIDCLQCVKVCPTGIDIRNGTQLECINCTACIDACDSIMDKVEKPRGLIRYASENNIKHGTHFKLTTRVIAYMVVLGLLTGGIVGLFAMRSDVETNLLRTPGLLFKKDVDGNITNVYDLTLINKTFDTLSLEFRVPIEGSHIKIASNQLELFPQDLIKTKAIISIPPQQLTKMNSKIKVEVWDRNKQIKLSTEKTNFLGPVN